MYGATRTEFAKQLEVVGGLVARLGEKTVADIHAAGLATQGDKGAASGILQGRKAADRLRDQIESECLDIMLLQQPLVGEDLRFVSGAFRMVSDLYHIDSMTRDIAFIVTETPKKSVRQLGTNFAEMCEKVSWMVQEALEAFQASDADRARAVIDYDDAIDGLYAEAEEAVIDLIHAAGKNSAKSLPELLMIAKYFERIGDLAQRIAAWAVFRATGERILTYGSREIDLEEEAENQ